MHDSTSFINVPLMLIESIEIKEIFYIYIYLKNVKSLRYYIKFTIIKKRNKIF